MRTAFTLAGAATRFTRRQQLHAQLVSALAAVQVFGTQFAQERLEHVLQPGQIRRQSLGRLFVRQLESQLQLQEGRLAVGRLHVHDDVRQGVEHHAVRTFLDHGSRTGGAPAGLAFLLLALFLSFFFPSFLAMLARLGGRLGLHEEKGRSAATAQDEDAGRDRDDENRRLLLGGGFAFGALFTFGSFLIVLSHARGSLESISLTHARAWLTMCFGGHLVAG